MKKFIILVFLVAAFFFGIKWNEYSSKQEIKSAQAKELADEKARLIEDSIAAAITGYEAKFQELSRKTGHDFLVFAVGRHQAPDVLRFRMEKPAYARESLKDIKWDLAQAADKLARVEMNIKNYTGDDRPAIVHAAQRPIREENLPEIDRLCAAITGNLEGQLKASRR